jgi:transposase
MLYPDESRLEIMVPVDVKTKTHDDYTNKIGISLGVHTLLTTSDGQSYGGDYGIMLSDKADWIRRQQEKYKQQRTIDTNPIGRKKYQNRKNKMDATIHSYINMQLNMFIQNEKPAVIYMPKLPPNSYGGNYGSNNYITTIWERGYIRNRLMQKCQENNIELREVYAKNISNECSNCGAIGRKKDGMFYCNICGTKIDEKINTAINAKNRGEDNKSSLAPKER